MAEARPASPAAEVNRAGDTDAEFMSEGGKVLRQQKGKRVRRPRRQ